MKRSFSRFEERLRKEELHQKIESRLPDGVSLRDLYGDKKSPARWSKEFKKIVAARKDVYRWLVKSGRATREVSRLFDRANHGVVKMVGKK